MRMLQDTPTLEAAEMVVKEGAQLINAYRDELIDSVNKRLGIGNDELFTLVQDFARLYWLKSLGLEEYEFGEGDE